ncbi:MAG: (Fe-S)-binding protein [Nitrospirae bacterium]|nr:(Fe-S)-binding protein [Nitrospirota bacterium]
MKKLADYIPELAMCVRCGTCRSTCPTVLTLGRETASARGKLSLIDAYINGEIGLSDTFVKHISECLLCGACRQSCPNKIPVPDIIMAARAEVINDRGLPLITSAIMKGLREPDGFVGKTLKLASFAQRVFFKDAPSAGGVQSRLPLPYIQDERLVPPLAKRFFMDMVGQGRETGTCAEPASATGSKLWMKSHVTENVIPAKAGIHIHGLALDSHLRGNDNYTVNLSDEKAIKVAFFAGCLINYVMPDIGLASLKVLEKAGASVVVPQGQTCCGMPALSMGDFDDARALALKNLEVFEAYDPDFITTSCATCTDGLKNKFRQLLEGEGPEMKRRVDVFCSKVRDITDLLVNELKLPAVLSDLKRSKDSAVVTYHDPCHLRRGLGIKDEPRELIETAGFRIKEMKHPCRCCGLGGSFSITNYELSTEINMLKAEDINDTGAEIAATACPGCMVQIRDGLHRTGSKARVKHVIELLAEQIGQT